MNPFKLIKALFKPAPRLAAKDCMERVRAGAALLIDVREPGEWAAGVAQGAMLLPLSDLTARPSASSLAFGKGDAKEPRVADSKARRPLSARQRVMRRKSGRSCSRVLAHAELADEEAHDPLHNAHLKQAGRFVSVSSY